MLDQVQGLHEAKLYEDVKILSSLAISFSQKNPEQFGLATKYQLFYFQGDAHFQTGDYHAANHSFKTALQIKALMKGRGKKNPIELLSEVEVKFKHYECYMKLNMHEEALAVLESIQCKQMSSKIYHAYAMLLQKLGKENRSITAYKEVLREHPMSLTAIRGLLSMGVRAEEIGQHIMSVLPSQNSESFEWLSSWIKAQGLAHLRDYKAAAQLLESIDKTANLDIMTQTAELHFLNGDYPRALNIFKRVRDANPLYHKKMDLYAYMLYQEQCKNDLLEKLASKASFFPEASVETWIINGYYCISFNKPHRAVYFAQKALTIEPCSFDALLMNGIALMLSSELNDALTKFREAMSTSIHRYEPYYYVIEIYWKTGRRREALACAIDFQKNTPSARSYALYAAVLMKEGSTNYEKAKPILEKAIALDPEYLDAVLLLAKVLQSSQNCLSAIELLERHCPRQPSIRYHRMMASLLLKTKDKMKALDHSVIAKRLEPLIAKGSLSTDTPLRFFTEEDSNDGEVNAACSDNEAL